jgi:hypothetical protein
VYFIPKRQQPLQSGSWHGTRDDISSHQDQVGVFLLNFVKDSI